MIVPVLACPVCIGSSLQNAAAFGGTTILLSAIPLGIIFGFGSWLRRRAHQADTDTEDTAPQSPR